MMEHGTSTSTAQCTIATVETAMRVVIITQIVRLSLNPRRAVLLADKD